MVKLLKVKKGTQIKFCGNISKKDSNGADEDYFVNKWYTVFNLDQTNLEEIKPELFQNNDNEMPLDLIKRDQAVDLFIKNTEAHIVHNKTGKCFYVPSKDMINMSPFRYLAITRGYIKRNFLLFNFITRANSLDRS